MTPQVQGDCLSNAEKPLSGLSLLAALGALARARGLLGQFHDSHRDPLPFMDGLLEQFYAPVETNSILRIQLIHVISYLALTKKFTMPVNKGEG
jgi:hypothetical protein